MRKILLVVLLFSCVATLFAQGKVWLTRNGQWTMDASKATCFAVIEKENGGLLKVDVFTLDSVKTETTHYSNYVDNPKDCVKEGLQTFWYANGTDSATMAYRRNKYQGDRIVYYPDHSIRLKAYFKNGRREGLFQLFYPNGTIRRTDIYKDGVLTEGHLYAEDGSEMKYEPYEVMPQFPGGNRAVIAFLSKNIHYPKDAQKARVQGRVIMQFVVDADGAIVSPKVVKGVSASLDNEALRVVKKMASEYKWIPARQDGRNVRVKYTLPVTFRL